MLKASEAADKALHEHKPCFLIICGFAGALTASAAPGALVIARTVIDVASPNIEYRPDSALLAAAESLRLNSIPIFTGGQATGNRVLIHASEKHALAARTGATAVDMETAGAVRAAEAVGIPWLAVRAITDSAQEDMPLDFNTLVDTDGSMDITRIMLAAITHPWKLPGLIQLGKNSSLAASNLATFLAAFLKHMSKCGS